MSKPLTPAQTKFLTYLRESGRYVSESGWGSPYYFDANNDRKSIKREWLYSDALGAFFIKHHESGIRYRYELRSDAELTTAWRDAELKRQVEEAIQKATDDDRKAEEAEAACAAFFNKGVIKGAWHLEAWNHHGDGGAIMKGEVVIARFDLAYSSSSDNTWQEKWACPENAARLAEVRELLNAANGRK